MNYDITPINELEKATNSQIEDGQYLVPIGFVDENIKETKAIDIYQLQSTINISQDIPIATRGSNGLMSASDKMKIDDLNILNGQARGSLRTKNSKSEILNQYSLGEYAFAEGYNTQSSGTAAHSQNMGTIANSEAQTAIGKYNIEDNNNQYALIIGNGTDDNNRSNAITFNWDGNISIIGNPSLGTHLTTKNYVDTAILNAPYVQLSDINTAIASLSYASENYVNNAVATSTSNLTNYVDNTVATSTNNLTNYVDNLFAQVPAAYVPSIYKDVETFTTGTVTGTIFSPTGYTYTQGDENFLDVYLNGLKLISTEYTAAPNIITENNETTINGISITLTNSFTVNSNDEILEMVLRK